MSKIKRFGLGIAAAVGLAVGGAQAAGVTDSEILLGTHLDLSGPVAAGMPQIRNGMQMRFDEANEKGGVNGRRFRLIVEDNAGQPQQAVRAADKLVRGDGVFAIVNPFGSGANAAAVKRAVDAGVLYFAPWGASAVLQRIAGNSPLLFTTIPNYDSTMTPALTWMIESQGAKKVGFIYQEGPFGELIRPGVNAALQAKGMTLAAEAGYKPGDIDFSSQVARMRAAGVDLIVSATITRETVGVAAETKKIGWNDVKILTAAPGRTGIVAALGRDAVEGMYGVGNWRSVVPARDPGLQTWAADFKRRFNLDPDENALLSYAYADWLVKGIEAAGRTVTAESVGAQLRQISYNHPILYEPVSFRNGHIAPESVQVEQIKGGVWTAVSPRLK